MVPKAAASARTMCREREAPARQEATVVLAAAQVAMWEGVKVEVAKVRVVVVAMRVAQVVRAVI